MHFISFIQTALLFKTLIFTKVPRTFCRFTTIPSVHKKHPGKNSILAIGSSCMGRWRLRPNSGGSGGGSTGNEVGEVCGLTSDRIVAEVQAEKRPAAVLSVARRTAAAALLLRRGGGST
jgi:hypothetical protein